MMAEQKRCVVYFKPTIHRALRLKAAETDRSFSELVNEAVQFALAEDAEDLASFEARRGEPNLRFETVVKELRGSGAI